MNTCNIAIIDDDIPLLYALKASLKSHLNKNIEIHTFSTSNDFLDKFSTTEFYLVVIDLEMPQINGIEVIKQIKELKKHIPVIVLTGNSHLLRQNLDLYHLIYEVLIKPVESGHLANIIHEALAYIEFYNPPTKETPSIDDVKADQFLATHISNLNSEIKNKLFEEKINKHEIFELLNEQEKYIKILQNS